MTRGKKPEKPAAQAVTVDRRPGDTDSRATARAVLRPTIGAAVATQAVYGKSIGDDYLDVGALADELVEQCGQVRDGNMARMEAVLVSQAATLDALFNRLVQRAMTQEYMSQLDAFMRLALKAQAQARATVEALGELKNPRAVAFVKQANVGTNLQVNNGPTGTVRAGARARGETDSEQLGLLERHDGERVDARAAGEAGRGDSTVEAVDALDRAADRGR